MIKYCLGTEKYEETPIGYYHNSDFELVPCR